MFPASAEDFSTHGKLSCKKQFPFNTRWEDSSISDAEFSSFNNTDGDVLGFFVRF
jgi:hypothetical protein